MHLLIKNKINLTKYIGYLFALAISVLSFFVITYCLPPTRVGDGNEYYALFLAFKVSNLPWMTPLAYDQFSALFQSGKILGLIPVDDLRNSFPALRVGETSDFNHFWLYSFLAFLTYKVFLLIKIVLSIHESFIALHCIMFFLLVSVSFYFYRWKGILLVIFITLSSPIIWFIDKAHVEFFTYVLTFISVIFIIKNKYLLSSFSLAVASTQNPSFALVALIPFLYRIIFERKRLYSIIEVVFLVGTIFFVLLHPSYYFIRYGVITPQLLAGGASPGGHLSIFYIWLLDPDIGLLPNWPLGLVALMLSVLIRLYSKHKKFNASNYYLFFVLIYLFVGLYASSSTTNLNSGATPGIARYALWYIPLFFPIFLYLADSCNKYLLVSLGVIFSILMIDNLKLSNPIKKEEYMRPSRLSLFLQNKFPSVYNPPAQIFSERFSFGAAYFNRPLLRAVFGPDCRKVLIYPGQNLTYFYLPGTCRYDQDSVHSLINKVALSAGEPYYIRLSDSDVEVLKIKYKPGVYKLGLGQNGNWILGSGWSGLEAWGLWSDGSLATINIPCELTQGSGEYFSKILLTLHPFQDSQSVTLSSGGKELLTTSIRSGKNTIPIDIDKNLCGTGYMSINIKISNPQSPKALGQSQDSRMLGISFTEFVLQ